MEYCSLYYLVFFFKQKTAYEMCISDWSSDVCSSDLRRLRRSERSGPHRPRRTYRKLTRGYPRLGVKRGFRPPFSWRPCHPGELVGLGWETALPLSLRHSLESGNPVRSQPPHALDSRFRGNDKVMKCGASATGRYSPLR